MVSIDGCICRTWYRGQPLICNLCGVEGHKSANCPNKDKCRLCGKEGHVARSCPNPWNPTPRRFPIGANSGGNVPKGAAGVDAPEQVGGSINSDPAPVPPVAGNAVENQESVPESDLLLVTDPASDEGSASVAPYVVAGENCVSDGSISQGEVLSSPVFQALSFASSSPLLYSSMERLRYHLFCCGFGACFLSMFLIL